MLFIRLFDSKYFFMRYTAIMKIASPINEQNIDMIMTLVKFSLSVELLTGL